MRASAQQEPAGEIPSTAEGSESSFSSRCADVSYGVPDTWPLLVGVRTRRAVPRDLPSVGKIQKQIDKAFELNVFTPLHE